MFLEKSTESELTCNFPSANIRRQWSADVRPSVSQWLGWRRLITFGDFDLWSSVRAKPIKLILLIVAVVVAREYHCPRVIYYSTQSSWLLSIRSSESVARKQSDCGGAAQDQVHNVSVVAGQAALMELIFSNKSSKCGPNVIICRWRGEICAALSPPPFEDKDLNRRRETIRNWFDFVDFDLCWSCLLCQSVSQLFPRPSLSHFPHWLSSDTAITHDVCSMKRLAINFRWQCDQDQDIPSCNETRLVITRGEFLSFRCTAGEEFDYSLQFGNSSFNVTPSPAKTSALQ